MYKGIVQTGIQGVYSIKYDVFKDHRGSIGMLYNMHKIHKSISYTCNAVEITFTHSLPHVLRGLHIQMWERIVFPVGGELMQVLVDCREESRTFGRVEVYKIDDSNRMGFFLPAWVANGYCALGNEGIDYLYILNSEYMQKRTRNIIWNDPDLKISWPKDVIVSEQDKKGLTMRKLFPQKYL